MNKSYKNAQYTLTNNKIAAPFSEYHKNFNWFSMQMLFEYHRYTLFQNLCNILIYIIFK